MVVDSHQYGQVDGEDTLADCGPQSWKSWVIFDLTNE